MISFFIFYAIILCKENKNMKPNIEELRKNTWIIHRKDSHLRTFAI